MVKTLLFFINEWGNIVVPFDLLEGISSKKVCGCSIGVRQNVAPSHVLRIGKR